MVKANQTPNLLGAAMQQTDWSTIGKASRADFCANEAAFLLKLLAYNLMRRSTAAALPPLVVWRSSWIRRFAILIPARLLRSGGRWTIRRAPRPMLN